MAIAKICKLNLVAMSYDKDAILNALSRSNAVEVKTHAESKFAGTLETDAEELRAYLNSLETALSVLCLEVEKYEKERGIKSDVLKDGFDVSYSDFISAAERKREIDRAVEKINALFDEKNELKAVLQKQTREMDNLSVYSLLKTSFAEFSDTRSVRIRLGVVNETNIPALTAELEKVELATCEVLRKTDKDVLVCVIAHKIVAKETDEILLSVGFTDCPYSGEKSGEESFNLAVADVEETKRRLAENAEETYALKDEIKSLKIYCDYIAFALEKEELSGKLLGTERTFLLEAYVPEDAQGIVEEAIKSASSTTYLEFSELTDDDNPPTLMRNNRLIENFEGITNTYSAPNYKEFDPNTVMAFFYSLFMGFIIGDAGYGLLMAVCGWFLWYKNRANPTGMSRLAGVFAVGGIFAILWGGLFNSFFGFQVLPKTIMPDPQKDQWSLLGIKVPSVLLIALEIGVFQLFVGYLCKAVQEWRRGNVLDGICDGVVWAIFSVGVGLAIAGFIDEANIPSLGTVGGIIAGVSLAIAIVTAGRYEKFFGKFTKGFGTAYGVINYASDILSYARLYGLMLSGAVIAQIISNYGGQFVTSGNIGLIILGIVLFIVGHGFNLVMNLLGAYIHDARLQYVEFYGRFFEGEGELFTPLGSEKRYIRVINE